MELALGLYTYRRSSTTTVRIFFLIGSITAGATFTAGSAEAAKVMWVVLAIIAGCIFLVRKTKGVGKAAVQTEYSEADLREIYTALSLAKNSAGARRNDAARFSSGHSDD